MSFAPGPARSKKRRRAVVVGAAGQDGRLLCGELENDDYEVVRVERAGIRRQDGFLQPFDIRDADAAGQLVRDFAPDEIYYLAAHHHSSEESGGDLAVLLKESFAVHCFGLAHVLEAIAGRGRGRLFYASSSLVFGHPDTAPQNELTPFRPVCAYGTTKAAGMGICEIYRRERGVFCCSGILFNHESSYRSPQFVTKKIVTGAVDIHLGLRSQLTLGSLEAEVDWGAAADYVRAMRAVLSADHPEDFVIATGVVRRVKDFVEAVFSMLGMRYDQYVKETPELVHRAVRKIPLVGDATKLRRVTGWSPEIEFHDMIRDMVQQELASRNAHG
jgi:GDPmannose 4,6-dehydratase